MGGKGIVGGKKRAVTFGLAGMLFGGNKRAGTGPFFWRVLWTLLKRL